MTLTVGSLFAGYGGIELALASVLDVRPAWFVEFDKAPSKVLAHHWPTVPNHGDVTKVDWSSVEPVDIITGGSPCQDLSHAGKRAGMTEGTRSNLWVAMREAIATIRPRLVVWENVRGAFSAPADSALEPCSGCVGDGDDGPVLRALGRVLGDLADLGYDCRWYGLRAADVGAAHGRFRVFLFATPVNASGLGGLETVQHDGCASAGSHGASVLDEPDRDALRSGPHRGLTLLPTPVADNSRGLPSASTDYASLANVAASLLPTPRATRGGSSTETTALLPTPRATDGTRGGPNQRGSSGDLMLPSAVSLLPTPAVNDMGAGETVDEWDAWTDRMKAAHGNGNGHGKSLAIEAQRLLPTPRAGEPDVCSADFNPSLNQVVTQTPPIPAKPGRNRTSYVTPPWGDYAPAIARAEQAIGRPAPPPTEPGPKGTPRLSARFVEWLMCLPEGWVTDVTGLTRNELLKMLGNGVVPAQCAAALRAFLWDAYGIEAAA